MVVRDIVVEHNGTAYPLEYETEDGLEILRYQLFSLTLVPPEKQKIMTASNKPLTDESDLLSDGNHILRMEEDGEGSSQPQDIAAMMKADEELARALQAEDDALFLQLQEYEHGGAEFRRRVEAYINQVLQYEDSARQKAARSSVPKHELEEKAAVALAKEGKRGASQVEMEYAVLQQLLFWFKLSFRWVNAPNCISCEAETDHFGMGQPTSEELRFGGNRVELYRCRRCSSVTRFPRYNDSLKLVETRRGRCGEWANCFTLYCRAFGYQARLVLDFEDHVWTECFSSHLGRWIHLDPCEGVFDKPLLYEQGWGKRLSYVIALAKDGVYDVTKRYTRKWIEVLQRRRITSEYIVEEVIASLTAQLRSSLPSDTMQLLQERDKQEADELQKEQHELFESKEALPGRQSGTKEWRMARGELGVAETPQSCCPIRFCVDTHVSKIFEIIGSLCSCYCRTDSLDKLDNLVNALYKLLQRLKATPFKIRRVNVCMETDALLFCHEIGSDKMKDFLFAIGLKQITNENGESWICLGGDPVETALALPVALEYLKFLHDFSATNTSFNTSQIEGLTLGTGIKRLHGSSCQASGEEPPSGIATSAFDGLLSTKWEEPNGATGSWIAYYLEESIYEQVSMYDLTSANDCPERDPRDWVLEGSKDGGCTWSVLDSRNSEHFVKRFERKTFYVAPEKQLRCNALRFRFLSSLDPSSTSRLQVSCINFYKSISCEI